MTSQEQSQEAEGQRVACECPFSESRHIFTTLPCLAIANEAGCFRETHTVTIG